MGNFKAWVYHYWKTVSVLPGTVFTTLAALDWNPIMQFAVAMEWITQEQTQTLGVAIGAIFTVIGPMISGKNGPKPV